MNLKKSLNLNASLIGACLLVLSLPVFLNSCTTEEPRISDNLNLPDQPFQYFNAEANLATLGRVLFYDKKLSANNTVSCGSCHKQELAFADDRRLSLGFDNRQTRRNSMGIQDLNPFDSSNLFWDGRERQLRTMVLKPIVDHVEMGMGNMRQLTEKLQQVGDYKILFTKAFGTELVTEDRIAEALTAFVQSIQSQVFVDTTFSHLQGEALLGATLFVTKYECNSCHQIQSPHGYEQAGTFANVGLDRAYDDNGLGEVTRNAADNGKFKIPSLRNVALTAPYMHDGRFETLEEAIDHYSTGIEAHVNLDHRLANTSGTPKIFLISTAERRAIITFLHTLTSSEMLTHPRFSDPFRQ